LKSNSQSPPRKQSVKTQNGKKGMNNDLSLHNGMMGVSGPGSSSQQHLTIDHSGKHIQ